VVTTTRILDGAAAAAMQEDDDDVDSPEDSPVGAPDWPAMTLANSSSNTSAAAPAASAASAPSAVAGGLQRGGAPHPPPAATTADKKPAVAKAASVSARAARLAQVALGPPQAAAAGNNSKPAAKLLLAQQLHDNAPPSPADDDDSDSSEGSSLENFPAVPIAHSSRSEKPPFPQLGDRSKAGAQVGTQAVTSTAIVPLVTAIVPVAAPSPPASPPKEIEDAPAPEMLEDEEPAGADDDESRKRPLDGEAPAGEPERKRCHSGMFRERTTRYIMQAANTLRGHKDMESAAILEVLEELDDLVVDERTLSVTKIGREVAALQKHADAEISSKAKALVARWKKDREVRNKAAQKFAERSQLPLKEAKKIEEGLFNLCCPWGWLEGDARKEYQRNFVRLSNHLKSQGEDSLVAKLKSGAIAAEEVAFAPDEDLLSAEQRKRAETHRQAGLLAALAPSEDDGSGTLSSDYMCPKCQGSRTMYTEMQTGWHNDQQDVTILVKCLDCGERWKATDDHGLGS